LHRSLTSPSLFFAVVTGQLFVLQWKSLSSSLFDSVPNLFCVTSSWFQYIDVRFQSSALAALQEAAENARFLCIFWTKQFNANNGRFSILFPCSKTPCEWLNTCTVKLYSCHLSEESRE
jgi:hypothetical protein